ncbi:hypothetical protein QLH32_17620 [Acinetobacter corruptisaponis]|uniref:Uncharacterized protein n=1 Tax=Acinetobacter corruptisaponis TaxID=3045147 RepID=A0ABY8S4T0_9GAMM|nr:hypothetical protein [Acinetobacter sp. KCTC 92772]WHP05798.1 hypothetical protein QLH32_17620 [Acinetobacter sp. KCTC 92772]
MSNIPPKNQSNKILDLKDLLPEIPVSIYIKASEGKCLDQDETALLEKINRAAENASAPLMYGISAIGELLAHSHEEVSEDAICNIGWLLESLAKQADTLFYLQSSCDSLKLRDRENQIVCLKSK